MKVKPGTLLLRIETPPWEVGGVWRRLAGWIIPDDSCLKWMPDVHDYNPAKDRPNEDRPLLDTESGVRLALAIAEARKAYISSYMENIRLAHLNGSIPADHYKSEQNPLGLEEVLIHE